MLAAHFYPGPVVSNVGVVLAAQPRPHFRSTRDTAPVIKIDKRFRFKLPHIACQLFRFAFAGIKKGSVLLFPLTPCIKTGNILVFYLF